MNSLRPLLALLLLLAVVLHAQENPAPPVSPLEQKLREGLYAEEAKQDLNAAIKAYQEIVSNFDRDRETASSALFRLGEAYRKLNRPKDAAAAFRRVALEFPDRDPLARLARENLTALGEPLPAVPGTPVPPGQDPEEDKVLARLQQLDKDSPGLILKPGNSLKKNGCISFEEAVEAGYVRVAQWFLAHGLSVDETPDGACPLSLAAGFGQVPLVAFLLEKGAKPGGLEKSEYPLHAAAVHGHLAVIKLLVEKGAEVNGRKKESPSEKGESLISWLQVPLVAAACGGHVATVEFFLSRKADPNVRDGDPGSPSPAALLAAVEIGDLAMAKVLLENGADPATERRNWPRVQDTPTRPMQRRPNLAVTGHPGKYSGNLSWYNKDSQLGPDDCGPVDIAVRTGNMDMLNLLLQYKAPVNVKSYSRNSTPLELALLLNRTDFVTALLAAGADVKTVAAGGVRLIDFAIHHRNAETYALLRKAGAGVTGRSPGGDSALSLLGSPVAPDNDRPAELNEEYLQWVERLLNDGADPNGDDSFRPVNIAALHGSVKMIHLLKAKGANFTPEKSVPPLTPATPATPATTTAAGAIKIEAPLPLAARNFSAEKLSVVQALLDAGANIDAEHSREPSRGSSRRMLLPTWQSDGSFLETVAVQLPAPELLEKILKWNPAPGQSIYRVRSLLGSARAGSSPAPMDKDQANAVISKAPAVIGRLWNYQYVERNKIRSQYVWYQVFAAPGEGLIVPASLNAEPVNIVEALVWACEDNQDLKPFWLEPGPRSLPGLEKLSILRTDPATGKVVRREEVNLLSLIEKGDVAALPALHAGDVLEGIAKEQPVGTWRELEKSQEAFFRKAMPARTVTVKAGSQEQQFKITPWLKGFRWVPGTDTLAIQPLVSQVVRYLPKPAFFYQMNAVRLTQKGKEPRVLDLTKPIPPESDIILRDGDQITIGAAPENDPALTARLQNGIFITGPGGFLREVFHDPARPPLNWNGVLEEQILLRFSLSSESLIPDVTGRNLKPPAGGDDRIWGACIEVADPGPPLPTERPGEPHSWQPRGALGMSMRMGTNIPDIRFTTDGKNTALQVFTYPEGQFILTPDGWVDQTISHRSVNSFTLDEIVRTTTAPPPGKEPSPEPWGTWEFIRNEKSLTSFTPGKDSIPLIFLRDDDIIKVSEKDAARGVPPPFKHASKFETKWTDRIGLMNAYDQPQQVPQPGGRKRVVLPTQSE